MRRTFCLLFTLLGLSLSEPHPAVAQDKMRIAWAGSTPSNTPIWVADQKGFFKRTASPPKLSPSAPAPSSFRPCSPAKSTSSSRLPPRWSLRVSPAPTR
jgi:hypothetical protein